MSESKPQSGAASVKVKTLNWSPHGQHGWGADMYLIYDRGEHWADQRFELSSPIGSSQHATLEEAKAAAQSDYERRILSAIEAVPTAAGIACRIARRAALEQAAITAYRTCAQTRHVTLGDAVSAAILSLMTGD